MEIIIPCQLQTYFALIYNMCTLNSIINNTSTSTDGFKKFKQILITSNNKKIINYLPIIKSPNSCVIYWRNILKLHDNKSIESFNNLGYSSTDEILADITGLYKFFTKERFVYIYAHMSSQYIL